MKVTWELEANIYSILKKTKRKQLPNPSAYLLGKQRLCTYENIRSEFKLFFLVFQSKNYFNQHDIN
jgi:hypothetical protein